MASERHQPSSWMCSLEKPAHRRAVAPPGHSERAERSEDEMCVVGKRWSAAWRRHLVMMVEVTSLCVTREPAVTRIRIKGVWGVARCCRRRRTIRPTAFAGHKVSWVLALWPTRSPLTAFFWSSKIRLTSVIRSRRFKSFKGAEGACRTFVPWWIWTCSRRKGEDRPSPGLPVPVQYSPGRSKKKKATMQRSTAWRLTGPVDGSRKSRHSSMASRWQTLAG